MHVGIIGAGSVGGAVARRLVSRGHSITLSFARDSARLRATAAEAGPGARAGTPEEAATAEVVVLATPWSETLPLVTRLAGDLAGRIVWDTTNPMTPDLSALTVGTDTSGGEQIALAAPRSRVVKAVVPFAELLRSPSTRIGPDVPSVFVSGDDAEARRTVGSLVRDLDVEPVDCGPLRMARCIEPMALLLVHLAYREGLGPRIGTRLLRDADSGQ